MTKKATIYNYRVQAPAIIPRAWMKEYILEAIRRWRKGGDPQSALYHAPDNEFKVSPLVVPKTPAPPPSPYKVRPLRASRASPTLPSFTSDNPDHPAFRAIDFPGSLDAKGRTPNQIFKDLLAQFERDIGLLSQSVGESKPQEVSPLSGDPYWVLRYIRAGLVTIPNVGRLLDFQREQGCPLSEEQVRQAAEEAYAGYRKTHCPLTPEELSYGASLNPFPSHPMPSKLESSMSHQPRPAPGTFFDDMPLFSRHVELGPLELKDAQRLVGSIRINGRVLSAQEILDQDDITKVISTRDIMTGEMSQKVHSTDHNGEELLFVNIPVRR